MKATVKKLVVELNGKDIELTMAQARELFVALGELFQEKTRDVFIPQPYPVRPYRWPWREPYWLCSSGAVTERLYTLAEIEALAKQWRDENEVTNDAQWIVSHLITWLARREKECGNNG